MREMKIIPVNELPKDETGLLEYVTSLVTSAKSNAASQVNATLTLRNWMIGRAINQNILENKRADYGKQIVVSLSQQLTKRFGRGYEVSGLMRMLKFAVAFPDYEIVVSLIPQLSWTKILALLPLKSGQARDFYTSETISKNLSVRELRDAIKKKSYERRNIANSQIPEGSQVPKDTFTDPMILDMLNLHDSYSEQDLESAILHDLREFMMEFGQGLSFVASQKRMRIDDDTEYRLDLLFFSRPLRRLVAVELKLGKFKSAYKGQMEGYLKWLDRYERQDNEEAPIGLILCSEASRDEVELLDLHKDGILVAEYWTELPQKEVLESKLQEIVRNAKERLERRGFRTGFLKENSNLY
jgi:predicted nuclease of restriction endonuclease-like (RecB) superfamily